MNAYCAEVRKLKEHFQGLEFHHVSRDNNVAADILSKLGSKRALVLAGVFAQDLRKPSSDSSVTYKSCTMTLLVATMSSWRKLRMTSALTSSLTSWSRGQARDHSQAQRQLRRPRHRAVPEVRLQWRADEMHPLV
jgi:hypothetical protein